MKNTMYIGSGSVYALLSGLHTKTHAGLMQQFVSGVKPHYNAYSSPIDALRTGQILEDRFAEHVGDEYYTQMKVKCDEMDVLIATLDFVKLSNGKVIDFIELKTCAFDEFITFNQMTDADLLTYTKKKNKRYYNQIQHQLLCTGLNTCKMTYLVSYTYVDEDNYSRVIKKEDYRTITVSRDEKVISLIKERAYIFQQIRDCYSKI